MDSGHRLELLRSTRLLRMAPDSLLEEAFARSVSRSVMKELLNRGDADQLLRGSTRMATVLFADVRSFIHVSELLPPEDVIGGLNEYLGADERFCGRVPGRDVHSGRQRGKLRVAGPSERFE